MFLFVHSLKVVLWPLLSAAISDESGSGGALVSGHALCSLQAHGFLPVHHLGLHHYCLQDAVPAQRGQP